MPSLTVENYLKAALQISLKSGSDWVSTGELAAKLDVAPGTVTSMLKTLSEADLASYKPYEGVKLTRAGRRLALRMLRRHRLIELFLVETLNLTWDQVHEEAENMEHAVSDFLIDRLDEYLGHPETDPHGSPIPSAEGEMRTAHEASIALNECPVGANVRFVRVVNQAPEFLRYLTDSGFELGAEGEILQNNSEAGIITARLNDRQITIGHDAADSIRVVEIGSRV